MEDSIVAGEVLWVEQQRINRARIQSEGHNVLKYFLLVLAFVAVIVAAAAYFPAL